MKYFLMSIVIIVVLAGRISAQTFTLKSNELGGQATDKQFANIFGCNGQNVSPQLYWENAPKETQSFAITMYDKDAPTGSGFWHWVIYNIPANVTELKSDAGNFNGLNLPAGSVNGNNDAGAPGYVGPCPPPGPAHMYILTVYALNTKLELDKNSSAAVIGFMLNSSTIEKSSVVFYAQR